MADIIESMKVGIVPPLCRGAITRHFYHVGYTRYLEGDWFWKIVLLVLK